MSAGLGAATFSRRVNKCYCADVERAVCMRLQLHTTVSMFVQNMVLTSPFGLGDDDAPAGSEFSVALSGNLSVCDTTERLHKFKQKTKTVTWSRT